ncbi:hypothetical protein B0T20DRAFT_495650 [Sordaria brevicollis]|uniref:Uncharacterized protein n=1 Tax=Sordaria brevicollis TaxID=83679 RepID=A0AAE0UDN3_SORBR|nr:hypothetical protein B0T20DRAFT_495650 [Sordaria brevicollis]
MAPTGAPTAIAEAVTSAINNALLQNLPLPNGPSDATATLNKNTQISTTITYTQFNNTFNLLPEPLQVSSTTSGTATGPIDPNTAAIFSFLASLGNAWTGGVSFVVVLCCLVWALSKQHWKRMCRGRGMMSWRFWRSGSMSCLVWPKTAKQESREAIVEIGRRIKNENAEHYGKVDDRLQVLVNQFDVLLGHLGVKKQKRDKHEPCLAVQGHSRMEPESCGPKRGCDHSRGTYTWEREESRPAAAAAGWEVRSMTTLVGAPAPEVELPSAWKSVSEVREENQSLSDFGSQERLVWLGGSGESLEAVGRVGRTKRKEA